MNRDVIIISRLYIFWFLHQTTTCYICRVLSSQLYIFWFLHQTTTPVMCQLMLPGCISFDSYIKPQPTISSLHHPNPALYIFWFLHQTTTVGLLRSAERGCISFDSYIKPQLRQPHWCRCRVVYLLIPTSNHNYVSELKSAKSLYIFWFLHQTTTSDRLALSAQGCISFDSYIKPQLLAWAHWQVFSCISFDSYIKPQPVAGVQWVVEGCISFDSYIKPQLILDAE